GPDLITAYQKALACDSTSAFGGIIAMNRKLDAATARAITGIFTEVIIAPDATEEAIAVIAARKNLRLLLAGALPDPREAGLTAKTVAGGLLVQSRDNAVVDDMTLKVVTKRAPTEAELRDLRFAFR
ncbi:bifunctional phosphoribosylaminoimidazolecarboxamide formyltransferase/IMP cyclohydrolase, partial [Escherichia coli]|nr:bifunctional phosphoribosylaminoimidazolecarboxamide formyltransferase/IMP cyclohydrolase [Escherichia coli]